MCDSVSSSIIKKSYSSSFLRKAFESVELSDFYKHRKWIDQIIFRTTVLSFPSFSVQFFSLCAKSCGRERGTFCNLSSNNWIKHLSLFFFFFSNSQHFSNVMLWRTMGLLSVNLQVFSVFISVLQTFEHHTKKYLQNI